MVDLKRHLAADSVGLVEEQRFEYTQSMLLESGFALPNFEMVYETYGSLNDKKNNAILVCHALSGNHHAAGFRTPDDKRSGWWDGFIGPGKVMDTNKFFIISPNNIGSCFGTTGPTSINPETGKAWGHEFPLVTIKDWVSSQKLLAEHLGIRQFAAVIGGSMGGMQAMQWAIDFPDWVKHAAVIAAAPKLSAQNIAFNEVARQAIMSDPQFHDGNYAEHSVVPEYGLKVARMLAHITYLSDEAMRDKFGRDLRSGKLNYDFGVDFQVESYLRYQGQNFSKVFDANTYLLMTKILDYFDPARDYDDSLELAFKETLSKFFVVSFTTDWRFAPNRSREIVDALLANKKKVTYAEVEAKQGHDSFLLDVPRYKKLFAAYMNTVEQDITHD